MNIDMVSLDTSPTPVLTRADGLNGVLHHGRDLAGLEVFVLIASTEGEATLTMASNGCEPKLTCIFSLGGQVTLASQRLDVGFGWHNYGAAMPDLQISGKGNILLVGYRASQQWLSRLASPSIDAIQLDAPAIHRISSPLAACLNLLATPPITGLGSNVYRWGKLLEAIALHAPTLGCDAARGENEANLGARERDAVARAAHILSLNLAHPPSLHDLAEVAGLSQRRLVQGFRDIYGSTVFGYLREARLAAARKMLEESDMPLKQIAFHVGYGHANNFIAAYRERFGNSPRRHVRELTV